MQINVYTYLSVSRLQTITRQSVHFKTYAEQMLMQIKIKFQSKLNALASDKFRKLQKTNAY